MTRPQSLLCFLFILLLTACGQTNETPTAVTPTPLPTPIVPDRTSYTVAQGNLINAISFNGRVAPVQEQRLFFRTDGFVDQIFVQRGDYVEAGTLLAQLEIGNLQSQLAQTQLSLETAETRLAKAEQDRQDAIAEAELSKQRIELQLQRAQGGGNSATLVSVQIELENAQQRLANAESELQKSLEREWEPEELRRQYERGVEQAKDSLQIAQARYQDALAGSRTGSYDRDILALDLEMATLRLEQLQRGIDPLLALDVERVRLDLAKIEAQIADAQLIAPFAGEILSIGVQAGSRAEAFRSVIVIADPTALEITADLGLDTLNQLSTGQVTEIALANRPGQTYAGEIRYLPVSLTGIATGVQETDTRTRITFEATAVLSLGELVTINVILEEKTDVLWLPPAAIRTFQGRTFVVVQEETGQRRVDVLLGIQTPSQVEILEGVTAGQLILGE